MAGAANLARQARALLAACILSFSGAAYAQCADPLALEPEFGAFAFTQTRHLSGVRAPLVSRGQAIVAQGSVDWRVTSPLDIRTQITASGITQSIEGGAPQRLGGQGDAFLASAGLLQLLSGDLASLANHYNIAPTRGPSGWRVRLTPKSETAARFLSYIEAGGCERVAHVEVRQANGDWMEIALSPAGS
ncbi:MAG: outer membrane lipoprotein carrier protein LolA [Terricaulis sp.]|nr:outer membrane lipoprotein carrier protein LolA [Terricaulis sp.]